MSTPTKITDHECIKRMVRSIIENDTESFYMVVNNYIEYQKTAPKGSNFALTLASLIKNKPQAIQKTLRPLTENGTIKDFLYSPVYSKKYLQLNEQSQSLYDNLLAQWNNRDAFYEHNINTENKILLYGPTGNGKTSFVKNIAIDAGLPYYEIKTSEMVNAKIGQTAKNISNVFSQLKGRIIVFYDEIDSISMNRGGETGAMGEYDKALNSLLISIDNLDHEVILFAATNRKELMDHAFVRRFDVVHEISEPNQTSKQIFTEQLIKIHNIETLDAETQSKIIAANSYSDIEKIAINSLRKSILSKINKKYNEQ